MEEERVGCACERKGKVWCGAWCVVPEVWIRAVGTVQYVKGRKEGRKGVSETCRVIHTCKAFSVVRERNNSGARTAVHVKVRWCM